MAVLAGRLPVASSRTTLMSPVAISSIDKMPSLFFVAGLSCFGGGYPTRAIVADVHPLHHPPQASKRMFRVGGSSRRCATARMTAHTAAQEMLYPVYVLRRIMIRVVLGFAI